MIQFSRGINIMEDLFKLNSFSWNSDIPLIAVLRNTIISTDGGIIHCNDNGENICDTILLIDSSDTCIALSGRSFPHKKYQRKQVEKTAAANYIATGYYPMAWRKGYHFQYPALKQNIKFMIWRSTDMILGDDDDYNQFNIVSDNFHGFAPYSAGCVTVEGKMFPEGGGTGDWKVAYNWLYSLHKMNTFISAVILNFTDLRSIDSNIYKLRYGSSGERVKNIQFLLKNLYPDIRIDGDFGPYTHTILRKFQKENYLDDDGICGPLTMEKLTGG